MDVTITHPTNQSKTAWMDKEKKYEVDGINHQSITSDSMANVITNLGITAALMASIALSIILTVTKEELIAGDILRLSQKNPAFRHHFSPNTTLNLCFGNYKKSSEKYRPQDRVDTPETENQGITQYYWNKCRGKNLIESSRIASLVTPEKYEEWLYTETDGKANFWHVGKNDMPSKLLARDGFITCVLYLAAVFVSLVLLISLEFSGARKDPKHFKQWYKLGVFQVVIGYLLLMAACIEFIRAMAAVIMIRFPLLGHSNMWQWEVNLGFWILVGLSIGISLCQFIQVISCHKLTCGKCGKKIYADDRFGKEVIPADN